MKRINPDTSLAAQRSVHEEMKKSHYGRIISALKILGVSNYENIANYAEFKNANQVARRLKEMMPPTVLNPKALNLVFQPGSKSPTSSGRMAYNYQLTSDSQPKTEVEQNVYKKGEKAFTDYTKEISASSAISVQNSKQATLFES